MKTTFRLESDQLNKEDLRILLQAVRLCEMANFPNKEIRIFIEVPELTTDEMNQILKSIKPPYGWGPKIITLQPKG
jgi:hypothetical protein